MFEIFPESPTQFFARWGDYFLTFAEDTEGEVPHVLIRNEGVESKRVKKRRSCSRNRWVSRCSRPRQSLRSDCRIRLSGQPREGFVREWPGLSRIVAIPVHEPRLRCYPNFTIVGRILSEC